MRGSFLQKSEGVDITFLDETYGTIVALKHENGVNNSLCVI